MSGCSPAQRSHMCVWKDPDSKGCACRRRQLQRAQSETEKLAAAAENYKRDLLRQRAADAEHEVATLKDRLKESVSDNESAS